MRREDGFTLTELLVVGVITSIVLTLGVYSLRRYWQVRALNGAVDQVLSELRTEQQEASTATHPWVYGAWFKATTPEWGTLRGNAQTGVCQVLSRRTLGSGVRVSSASFDDLGTQNLTLNCTNQAGVGAEVVFFFARGTATAGTVALSHPEVSGGTVRTIRVYPVTGKVARV